MARTSQRESGKDLQAGIRDRVEEAYTIKDTPVLLRVVRFCRAFLVGILLPALPPGHLSRVTASIRGEGLSPL